MVDQVQSDLRYKFILGALICLVLGLLTSPTIVAGFQILMLIPALITLFKSNDRKLPISSYLLLAVGSWGLISATYNFGNLHSISKSYREATYYFYGVLFIFPLRYFFEKCQAKHVRLLLNILVFTIVVAFFVGITKSWFKFDIVKFKAVPDHHNRSGGFLNYMRYGYGSAMLALLGIGLLFNKEKIKEYVNIKVLITGVVFCLMAIGTSQTRGALLGLVIGLPFLLLRFRPKLFKILSIIAAFFICVVAYFSFVSKATDYRFLNINDGSNSARVTQWLSAFRAAQDNPVFGLGPDEFSYHAIEYKIKYNIGVQYYGAHAHNILLEHAANIGIVGVSFLILFFIFWFKEMISLKNDFGWVIASYILAFLSSGQVENLFDVVNSNIIFFVYSYSQYVYGKTK
jgi:O-antigen ligase